MPGVFLTISDRQNGARMLTYNETDQEPSQLTHVWVVSFKSSGQEFIFASKEAALNFVQDEENGFGKVEFDIDAVTARIYQYDYWGKQASTPAIAYLYRRELHY